MRLSSMLALGVVLFLGASARAQDTGPGFFGFAPKLITGPNSTGGQFNFPIPNRTIANTNPSFMDLLLSKFKNPIGLPTYATTTMPTYSPLMPQSYLQSFHYLPPGTVSK